MSLKIKKLIHFLNNKKNILLDRSLIELDNEENLKNEILEIENIIKRAEAYDVVNHHRMVAQNQKQSYNNDRKNILPDKILIEADFKPEANK